MSKTPVSFFPAAPGTLAVLNEVDLDDDSHRPEVRAVVGWRWDSEDSTKAPRLWPVCPHPYSDLSDGDVYTVLVPQPHGGFVAASGACYDSVQDALDCLNAAVRYEVRRQTRLLAAMEHER